MADFNNYYQQQVAPGVNPYGYTHNYMGGFNNPGYVYNNTPAKPSMVNALTPEEMKELQTVAPSKLDISITKEENLASRCNHHDANGIDKAVPINDGTGDMYCPICKKRFNPINDTKEEITNYTKHIVDAMQTCKWVGDLNHPLINDYMPMIPLLEKLPDIYEYSMKNFNRYVAANNYNSANDAAIYSQYDQLMGNAPANPYFMYQQAPAYGQPQMQPMYGQPNTGYNQAPPVYGQPQMQPMYGQPQAQVNPYQQQPTQAYANMPYGPGSSAGAPATNVNPMQTQPNQSAQVNPAQQPYAPNYATAGQTTAASNGAEKTDGNSATKETVVKLK